MFPPGQGRRCLKVRLGDSGSLSLSRPHRSLVTFEICRQLKYSTFLLLVILPLRLSREALLLRLEQQRLGGRQPAVGEVVHLSVERAFLSVGRGVGLANARHRHGATGWRVKTCPRPATGAGGDNGIAKM